MHKASAFLALVFLFLTFDAFAQTSVKITPKKVTYRRFGSDIEDYKKTFTVRYPVIKDRLRPALKRRIEDSINYWRVFKTSLKEQTKSTWTYSLDYTINYNANGILDISLAWEGSGAYPDAATKNLVIDLKTGNQLQIKDLFNRAMLTRLLSQIRKKSRQMEDQAIKESAELMNTLAVMRESSPEFHPTPERIKLKDLEGFSVSVKGVTFLYNYNFPHAIQALEPEGRYFFSYNDLKPFIKTDSILSQFVR
jgi:hypothetical protein